MFGIILFLISFIMVLSSSYFLTSVIESKKPGNALLYLVLIFITQIILGTEILSLCGQVNAAGMIIVNSITFLISLAIWAHMKTPVLTLPKENLIKGKIIPALRKDRILLILAAFFLFSLVLSLFYTLIIPSNSWDGMSYHLARIGFWLQNGSLAHYNTGIVRQLAFPVNSEILILWPMIFLKRDYMAIFPEFLSYLGCIGLIWLYLSYFKVSVRRILWAILIFGSLPAVILEASSVQTNLLVAFLLFCSFYLYIYGIKEDDKKAVIFSAIAFVISFGVKYTAFLFLPVLVGIYVFIAKREQIKPCYKPLLLLLAAFIPAFVFLSSYNYILNFIDFGNFIAPVPYLAKNSVPWGYHSFTANLIRYLLLFIDFTGLKSMSTYSPMLLGIKDYLFHLFGLQSADGLAYADITGINTTIHENFSTFGILGFVLFLPLVFKYSLTNLKAARDKMFYICLTGVITIGFILSISMFMGFVIWTNRYLLSAVALSAPIFALSYKRRTTIFKIIIMLIVLFNYIVITPGNAAKPLFSVIKLFGIGDYNKFRQEIRLRYENAFSIRSKYYYVVNYLGKIAKDNAKVVVIASDYDWIYPFFEENPTWKIYAPRYESLFRKKNYDDYDFIIFFDDTQDIDAINNDVIKFNYMVEGNQVTYSPQNPADPIIMYIDRTDKLTTSKVFFQSNVINFEDIPDDFKLVKRLNFISMKPNITGVKGKSRVYVYEKISKNSG
jgi:hypothetical protein